jgi:hypothetical protein
MSHSDSIQLLDLTSKAGSMAIDSKFTVIHAGDHQVDYFFDTFEEARQFFASKTLVDLVIEQLELKPELQLLLFQHGEWHIVTERAV